MYDSDLIIHFTPQILSSYPFDTFIPGMERHCIVGYLKHRVTQNCDKNNYQMYNQLFSKSSKVIDMFSHLPAWKRLTNKVNILIMGQFWLDRGGKVKFCEYY